MNKTAKLFAGLIVLLVGLFLVVGCQQNPEVEVDVVYSLQNADVVYDCDVVVVGSGGAGFSAALTAKQAGKKVIILEQLAFTGGNTLLNGGGINCAVTDEFFRTRHRDTGSSQVTTDPGDTITTHRGMTPPEMTLVQEKIDMDAGAAKYAHLIEGGFYSAGDVARINAAMKPWQDKLAADFEIFKANTTVGADGNRSHYFDSPWLHALQTYEGGDFIAKPELVEVYANNAVASRQWLIDIGGTPSYGPVQIVGSLWYRCWGVRAGADNNGLNYDGLTGGSGVGFMRPQEYEYMNTNGERHLQHHVKKILMADGKAVGVAGTYPGGVFAVKAKAVVMATGGFGGNWEMLEKYQPNKLSRYNPTPDGFEIKWKNIRNYGTTNSIAATTGEGMLIAQAAGANLYQMEQIQFLPSAGSGAGQLDFNHLGQRVVNESGRRDELSLASIAMRNKTYNDREGKLYGATTANTNTVEQLATRVINHFYGGALTNTAQTGWTTEMTDHYNLFVTNFNAMIQDYNDSYDDAIPDIVGKLEKTGKMGPNFSTPTNYGMPNVHHTMGGIEINGKTEVLDRNGDVIPGLFAAGECIGGMHGSNRIGGNAVTDITTFGRIAGRNAAAYAK